MFAEILHLQLSIERWQFCSSKGYCENFIEQERSRVNLKPTVLKEFCSTSVLCENLLNHVKYFLGVVEPNIMVGNCHRLESDLFGIFEI